MATYRMTKLAYLKLKKELGTPKAVMRYLSERLCVDITNIETYKRRK